MAQYKVEIEAWEATSDGGAEYVGFEDQYQLGRFETLEEALTVMRANTRRTTVYFMTDSPTGSWGSPIAKCWGDKIVWQAVAA